MKRILALTLCFGLAMPLLAVAQEDDDQQDKQEEKAERRAAKAEEKAQRRKGRGGRAEVQQTRGQRGDDARPRSEVQQPEVQQRQVQQPEVQQRQVRQQAEVRTTAQPRMDADARATTEVNTTRRTARGDWRTRRAPSGQSWTYNEARRYHGRHGTRDRSWWRSNYNRFALFGGGYYYWDRGYWYPAYGYDPRYSTYRYDEPIYGYNQMEPGRVLRNVQIKLRRMGYYRGSIDGLIGPMTRSALTRFQRDNALPITRRIDGPTLAALGLV
jgi:hypothetical protein